MKICFVSPYFYKKHRGGGERHILSIAAVVAKEHEVCVAVSPLQHQQLTQQELHEYRSFYHDFTGYDLSRIQFVSTPLFTGASALKKLWWTRQFDYIYYATDGSFFFSLARHNNLHVQVPFTHRLSVLDRLKLLQWSTINTNSKFTKNTIEQSWGVAVDVVHYPKVDVAEFSPNTKKKKSIVAVGRFFDHQHGKRQDVLIDAFSKFLHMGSKLHAEWELVLIGSVENAAYVEKLHALSEGLPVRFVHQAQRHEVVECFNQASFFWHAAGFGVDERTHPANVEHFGIVTIEALAAGAVPLVHLKGGQREILVGDLVQLGWESPDECAEKTYELLRDKDLYHALQAAGLQQARRFDADVFEQGIKQQFALH